MNTAQTTSTPSRIVLIFTAGISDLKFLTEDETLLETIKQRGDKGGFATIRDVHNALLRLGADRISLAPFEAGLSAKPNRLGVLFQPDANEPLGYAPCSADRNPFRLKTDPAGRLCLAADKLKPAWDALHHENVQVAALLGFRTEKLNDPDEPLAAEALIFAKLKAALNPAYARLVSYVQKNEHWDNPDGSLRTEVQDRIEAALRACRRALKDKPVEVWLATSGGVPGIKDLIRAAAELHFGPTRSLLKREAGGAANFMRAPQDGPIARRHALEFVHRGALIEAAAVADPFRDDPQAARAWVQPLRCAARLFDGNPALAYRLGRHPASAEPWEAQFPPPRFMQRLAAQISPADGPPLRCLLAALRAEAALRSGRWIEAINFSVNFFDAALRDGIERRFGRFDPEGGQILRLDRSLTPQEDKLLVKHKKNGPACLVPRKDATFTTFFGGRLDQAWSQALGPAFTDLYDRLKSQARHCHLRDYRNRNTHSLLTDEEIEAARRGFARHGIWAGGSLLRAEPAKAILSTLGHEAADNPLDALIAELSAVLLGVETADST